jgi:hypothetical protein
MMYRMVKMQYKIVIKIRADLLEKAVQELIDEGWIPFGGASVCVTNYGRGGDSWLHQQAMVKEEG